MQLRRSIYVVLAILLFAASVFAQSPNGTISGTVFDPAGKVIVGAEITVVNDATRVQSYTKTNNDGLYVLPNLPPGSYRLQVAKPGFKTLIKPDISEHSRRISHQLYVADRSPIRSRDRYGRRAAREYGIGFG